MHDGVEVTVVEQGGELVGSGEVGLREREVRVRQQVEQGFPSEEQGVRRDDAVPARQQLAREKGADVAGSAGDEDGLRCGHDVDPQSAVQLVRARVYPACISGRRTGRCP